MKKLELLVTEEINSRGIAVCLKPKAPEVITPSLALEIRQFQNTLADKYFSKPWNGTFYVIWYSHRGHGLRGRGLDFNYILKKLLHNKMHDFENYIHNLFDLLFLNYIGLGLPLINCSIVDREIRGISQEFFLLNKVNFIKRSAQAEPAVNGKICPVKCIDFAKNLVFPQFIYEENNFYHFNNVDINSMKQVIEDTDFEHTDKEKYESIQAIFLEIKNSTINEIYKMATNNMDLLKRLARMQAQVEKLN